MKIQQNTVNLIKEVLSDATIDAQKNNRAYSVVYVDTLQELIVIPSNASGDEFGWQTIVEISP
jgi:hypothetical protein